MMQPFEYIIAGSVLVLFALLTYGGFLIVQDKEQAYRDRRNGRKNNERNNSRNKERREKKRNNETTNIKRKKEKRTKQTKKQKDEILNIE